jgi:peptidyl-prolyl cis-trans isomerase A (cyclophilin A)
MKKYFTTIAMLGLALISACKSEEASSDAEAAAPVRVKMVTSMGDVVIELNAEKAPVTVGNFLKYVKDGHYSGTVFHRVINGFMIQGGGFALKENALVEKPTGDGIKNEGRNGLSNEIGSIAMARTADPDSATAQFFINVGDNKMLDFPNNGGYAVFGKVVEGMDVVNKIKEVETKSDSIVMLHPETGEKMELPSDDIPTEPVLIKSITVE